MNDPLHFTEKAAHKVYELIQDENNFALKLRAFVTGGGCSGMKYGFTFEEEVKEDDTIVERKVSTQNGDYSVILLVDALSFQYLAGAEIDYEEGIEGAQFIIRNPNAKTTCGCGSSFTTD